MKSLIPVGLLVAALAFLAVLQYSWIGEISQAERQRLENGIRDSSDRFSRDFSEEFSRIPRIFELGVFVFGEPRVLIERFREWAASSSHPNLIRNLYAVSGNPGEAPRFLRLDTVTGTVIPATLPTDLEFPRYLVIPRGIVIEMDLAVMANELFPALAARNFAKNGDQNYRIAVVKTGPAQEILYSTGEAWSEADIAQPDYAVDLFGGNPGPAGPRGGDLRGGPRRGGPPFRPPDNGRGPASGRGEERTSLAPMFRDFPGARLRLLVKHEAGSLESAVNLVRRRNLAVSFGILLVLAGAAFTVLWSSQRARTLGKMQVEFAAGVSHELRTPLAVIQSAAHNLRSGVIRDPKAIEQYAGMVHNEARRLSDMVEQVMTYAETQSGKKRYDISAVDVRDVIDQALRNTPPPDDLSVRVEQRVADDLPPALADPLALAQCLQNLVSNAFKYGGGRTIPSRYSSKQLARRSPEKFD